MLTLVPSQKTKYALRQVPCMKIMTTYWLGPGGSLWRLPTCLKWWLEKWMTHHIVIYQFFKVWKSRKVAINFQLKITLLVICKFEMWEWKIFFASLRSWIHRISALLFTIIGYIIIYLKYFFLKNSSTSYFSFRFFFEMTIALKLRLFRISQLSIARFSRMALASSRSSGPWYQLYNIRKQVKGQLIKLVKVNSSNEVLAYLLLMTHHALVE